MGNRVGRAISAPYDFSDKLRLKFNRSQHARNPILHHLHFPAQR